MVVAWLFCLERSADLHMAQLMPLSLTVSCFSKIQICFAFLVPAHPEQRAIKCVCVCVVMTLLPHFYDLTNLMSENSPNLSLIPLIRTNIAKACQTRHSDLPAVK